MMVMALILSVPEGRSEETTLCSASTPKFLLLVVERGI